MKININFYIQGRHRSRHTRLSGNTTNGETWSPLRQICSSETKLITSFVGGRGGGGKLRRSNVNRYWGSRFLTMVLFKVSLVFFSRSSLTRKFLEKVWLSRLDRRPSLSDSIIMRLPKVEAPTGGSNCSIKAIFIVI